MKVSSNSFQGKSYNLSPKLTKIIENLDIKGPQQRLYIGATGLIMQPAIDLYNPSVDEDTQKFSAAKSFVKTFVGTAVGYVVRSVCINLGNKIVDKGIIKPDTIINSSTSLLKKYKNSFGTLLGTLACLFTNFALDVPLNNFMLNKVVEKYHLNPTPKGGGK